jgi:hypothetical protein
MTKQRILTVGSWVMLLLYLSYYIAATSFYHVHYYGGQAIVHSHICSVWDMDRQSGATHQHTAAQLRSIAVLMDIVLAGIALVSIFFTAMEVGRIYIPTRSMVGFGRIYHRPVRAPPLLHLYY